MRLVDLEAFDRVGRVPVLELVGLGGVPEARVIDRRDVQVLGDTRDPRRQAVQSLAARRSHGNLEHRVMGDSRDTGALGRDVALPHAKLRLGHGVGGVRPAV